LTALLGQPRVARPRSISSRQAASNQATPRYSLAGSCPIRVTIALLSSAFALLFGVIKVILRSIMGFDIDWSSTLTARAQVSTGMKSD